MKWQYANYIHQTEGHSDFVRQAKNENKTPTFIWNVCTNQRCENIEHTQRFGLANVGAAVNPSV